MEVSKLLPEVYYKESRDFSYVGRVLEVVFNYLKTGADLVGVNPDNENVSSDLLELVCKTVGFESKHKYIKKDLIAVVSDFVNICRQKGSKNAIEEAILLLLNSQEISEQPIIDIDNSDSQLIVIKLPHRMTDTILLEDIFEYILPAGTLFRFECIFNPKNVSNTSITSTDTVEVSHSSDDSVLGQVSNDSSISEEYAETLNRSTLYTGIVAPSHRTSSNTGEGE